MTPSTETEIHKELGRIFVRVSDGRLSAAAGYTRACKLISDNYVGRERKTARLTKENVIYCLRQADLDSMIHPGQFEQTLADELNKRLAALEPSDGKNNKGEA